ncbi:hypothetical protein [Rhizobium mesosinicum]|uniref:Uncharacterized protein n=1 Tax=Rhizobium mesosinicum TaxID=335017 RepID=A0ABS7GVP2_9HYPH|nr:hypothetical protein [Rhizobium mesosinicum]MBW9053440.1 hypothetical protein [Rhizobium mesosinicum]
MTITAVRRLRMQFFVYCLPPRRLNRTLGWRQLVAAKVLVDHRQFGVQIIVGHDNAIDICKAELFAGCETMRAEWPVAAAMSVVNAGANFSSLLAVALVGRLFDKEINGGLWQWSSD